MNIDLGTIAFVIGLAFLFYGTMALAAYSTGRREGGRPLLRGVTKYLNPFKLMHAAADRGKATAQRKSKEDK